MVALSSIDYQLTLSFALVRVTVVVLRSLIRNIVDLISSEFFSVWIDWFCEVNRSNIYQSRRSSIASKIVLQHQLLQQRQVFIKFSFINHFFFCYKFLFYFWHNFLFHFYHNLLNVLLRLGNVRKVRIFFSSSKKKKKKERDWFPVLEVMVWWWLLFLFFLLCHVFFMDSWREILASL